MRPSKPVGGTCPHDQQRDVCNLTCKYNLFESDELRIDSWELKCLDCGYRETIAFRSDDEELDVDDPARCPFCQLAELAPGRDPCQIAGESP